MQAPTVTRDFRFQDRALLLGFYQRLFWNRLVETLPRSLTPNTITVVGETCALLAALTTYIGVRYHVPALYLLSGVLLFTYMTGDNIDGPHARRTQQTSALGEFLDHGLDGLASGSVLLCSSFLLRIDGIWMVLLLGLGAIGFMATFWAQYRTGLLLTPQISAMEGVTGASLFQVAMFILGEPSWLRFSGRLDSLPGVILIVLALSYLYAIASPVFRVARSGVSITELGSVLLIVVANIFFVFLGANSLFPSIALSLFVADVVCRMIVLRHRGEDSAIVTVPNAVPLLALGGAVIAPTALGLDGWALVAMVVTALSYVGTFARGIAEFRQPRAA